MNGFLKTELTNKILGLNPHIVIQIRWFKLKRFYKRVQKIDRNFKISKTYSGEGIVVKIKMRRVLLKE